MTTNCDNCVQRKKRSENAELLFDYLGTVLWGAIMLVLGIMGIVGTVIAWSYMVVGNAPEIVLNRTILGAGGSSIISTILGAYLLLHVSNTHKFVRSKK